MSVTRRFNEGRAPANWVCITPAGPDIRFEHRGSGLCLEAVKLDTRSGEPGYAGSSRWVIRCRQYAGETVCARPLRYVESKAEAVGELYRCMEKLNRQAAGTGGTDYVTATDVANVVCGNVGYGDPTVQSMTQTREST